MAFLTITATTPGPCACCGIGTAVLSCRTRGGFATFVGCDEFGNPSDPPRYYRRNEASGANQTKRYSDAGCTALDSTGNCTYTGWIQYDRVTGLTTTGGATTCDGVVVGTGSSCGQPVDTCNISWGVTPTTASRSCTGNCCQSLSFWFKCITDSLVDTLSDEDLADDAIARLLAGAGGVWSGYSVVGNGSGGTCLAPDCCKAYYQQRDGRTFAYGEAQFKLEMSALDPSTAYVVTVQVYRRLQGSTGPWVLLLDSPFGFTTDGAGNYTITDQDVPNLEGYETYVCCPFIYKP